MKVCGHVFFPSLKLHGSADTPCNNIATLSKALGRTLDRVLALCGDRKLLRSPYCALRNSRRAAAAAGGRKLSGVIMTLAAH